LELREVKERRKRGGAPRLGRVNAGEMIEEREGEG
jgi:hypothetical protein